MRRHLFIIAVPFLLVVSCFFKFAGTDSLYYEGKKSNPSLDVKRIWCSQCGCEAIEIKQMEKGKVVYEMLLNCTANCPPGVQSYKIEREYIGDTLFDTKYYLLVKNIKEVPGAWPLTNRDTAMIGKLRQFRKEPFYQQYCMSISYSYNGYMPTNANSIKHP